MSEPFGPRLTKECEAWARDFALDPPIVEQAVQGCVQILEAEGGRAGDPDEDDEALAHTLAKLRSEVRRLIEDDTRAPDHARHLEDIAQRLDRSIEHTAVLEGAGMTTELPDLRARLLAARAMVTAIRAALARRGRGK